MSGPVQAGHRAPNRERVNLWRLLHDGEWHDAHVVRHELMELVGNERGQRETETRRVLSAQQRHGRDVPPPPRVKAIADDRAAESGKRGIATKAISDAKRQGLVETKPDKTDRLMWTEKQPIEIRWVGPSMAGFAVQLAAVDAEVEAASRAAVEEVRRLHVPHPTMPEVCAEDNQPVPCRTSRILSGATVEELREEYLPRP